MYLIQIPTADQIIRHLTALQLRLLKKGFRSRFWYLATIFKIGLNGKNDIGLLFHNCMISNLQCMFGGR